MKRTKAWRHVMQTFNVKEIVKSSNWVVMQEEQDCTIVNPVEQKGFVNACFAVALALVINSTMDAVMSVVHSMQADACIGNSMGVNQSTMVNVLWREYCLTPKTYNQLFDNFVKQYNKGTYLVYATIPEGGHVSIVQDGVEYGTYTNKGGRVKMYWKLD